jgi:hypothetical protein
LIEEQQVGREIEKLLLLPLVASRIGINIPMCSTYSVYDIATVSLMVSTCSRYDGSKEEDGTHIQEYCSP